MENTTNLNSRVLGLATAAVLLVALALVTMAGSVSAQTGPGASCTGDNTTTFGNNYYGFDDFGNRLFSTDPTSREYALSTPLEAGTYVLDAVSYDGYPGRELIDPQPREQWYVELLAADGTVLATSEVTGDLEDMVMEATWAGGLGEVSIDQTAVTIRTVHASPGSASIDSVRPVCLGATGGPVEPEPVPTSSITVDFDSVNLPASNVMVVCGPMEESATGTSADLMLDGIAADSGCAVRYTPGNTCSVAVTPELALAATNDGAVNITIPETGDTAVVVDIDCTGVEIVAPVTTSTVPVETEVEGQVETPAVAPTAQVQPGTPAFTG